MIFDDVLGLTVLCIGNFSDGVHDSFGVSIVTDVLDPILSEIGALRDFNEDFQRQSLNIDHVLNEARTIQFNNQEQAL